MDYISQNAFQIKIKMMRLMCTSRMINMAAAKRRHFSDREIKKGKIFWAFKKKNPFFISQDSFHRNDWNTKHTESLELLPKAF